MRTLTVTLCALLVACGAPSEDVEEIRGVSFEWNSQLDRDPTEVLEVAYKHTHGNLEGAYVRFVGDANAHCRSPKVRVAGCWLPDMDLIILEYNDDITRTALLHELTHRAQFIVDGVFDLDHQEEPWWPLPGVSRRD